MVKPITIQDNGGDRYTITTTITTLGRRYDNNAESIVVNFPQAEIDAGHICTMIVTAFGKVVDHIEVENGVEVPITSNLSQYSEIKIGFSFTDDENYVKNSEIKTFKFLEAQKPDGFVPEPPQQSGSIDRLIRSGFVDVGQEGSYVIFYNLAHEEVARIRIQGGGGGGGCTVYVNGEEVEELLFTSDPQTQITALAEAIGLVETALGGKQNIIDIDNKLSADLVDDNESTNKFVTAEDKQSWNGKASVEYVDNKFNGANKAISYGDYETMITAFNALGDDVYSVGQNVYIVTREVPDLWISSIEETSVPYVYVDDATFVSALSTTGYVQVGYYKFSALETEKVDLTDYVTTNTEQTLTGKKKISNTELSFANSEASGNAEWTLEQDIYGRLKISRIYNGNKETFWIYQGAVLEPQSDGINHLGTSTKRIGNIYAKSGISLYTNGAGPNVFYIVNDNGYNAKIKMGNTENIRFMSNGTYFGAVASPIYDDTTDLGINNTRWKDLHLAGNLSDGTNSVSIAELIPTKVDYSSALVVDNDTNLTVKRKELYFVKSKNTIKMFVYYSAKNETESAVNSVRIINTNVVVNDTFIANGIKDMNGNALSSSISGTICSANQHIYNDGNVLTKAIRVSHTSTNQLTLYDGSAINIPSGANVTIDFMVEWFVG